MNEIDIIATAPLGVLVIGALLLILMSLFFPKFNSTMRTLWGVMVCGAAWCCAIPQIAVSGTAFHGQLFADPYVFLFATIILGGVALTFLLNDTYLEQQRVTSGADVDVLLLLTAVGGIVMVAASDLIVLFLGFEVLSIAVYVLSGLARGEKASAEASLKYFILGAFSSAFMLYGMVLVYGATGSMQIAQIANHLVSNNPMLLVGIGLLVFGFGFKVSLVPFHFWTPDVYQGSPSSIAGFMAVVVKAAAFGSFLRLMHSAFGSISGVWVGLLWILCVATMTFGNIVALRQNSIKRMLAYSSIAHAGYALMGFLVLGSNGGGAALIFYLLAYSLMTLGAFGVLVVVTSGSPAQYEHDDIQSLEGIGWTHPLLGLVMTISMLSLAGIPPLAGFMGKFYLFNAAIEGGYVGLAIIAAINSVISLAYYLRVIVVMYFAEKRNATWSPPQHIVWGSRLALSLVTIGMIYFGLFSARYFLVAQNAIDRMG